MTKRSKNPLETSATHLLHRAGQRAADIFAEDIINFQVDFDFARPPDEENAFINWGLTSDDFGAIFYFSNGCVLVYPAVE